MVFATNLVRVDERHVIRLVILSGCFNCLTGTCDVTLDTFRTTLALTNAGVSVPDAMLNGVHLSVTVPVTVTILVPDVLHVVMDPVLFATLVSELTAIMCLHFV